jgi:hypothetical protein
MADAMGVPRQQGFDTRRETSGERSDPEANYMSQAIGRVDSPRGDTWNERQSCRSSISGHAPTAVLEAGTSRAQYAPLAPFSV